jgi:ABC-type cobalamin/Fe3+-siderophores transport system ATPase subunit
MSEIEVTVKGPAGSGKTSLLRVLANAVEWTGGLVRIENDEGVERATVTITDPVGLAKWADRNFEPVEDERPRRRGASDAAHGGQSFD